MWYGVFTKAVFVYKEKKAVKLACVNEGLELISKYFPLLRLICLKTFFRVRKEGLLVSKNIATLLHVLSPF